MCGEKSVLLFVVSSVMGSPPRVRGEGAHAGGAQAQRRITPACAGRSSRGAPTACIARDHPRVCGEKDFVIYETPPVLGSPPRVRGEVTPSRVRNRCIRITPACAGRRSTWGPHRCSAGDHPRVCGEKHPRRPRRPSTSGSPPRVRGEADRGRLPVFGRWITPACAGRSLPS